MEKYVRVVFEEEFQEDVEISEMIDALKVSIKNWLKKLEEEPLKTFEDVEVSYNPYERME